MDVILLERIEKLGQIGDVVTVKNGYARNFLLPRGKALRANEANRKVFEANRERIEAENAERRKAAEKEAKAVDGTDIELIRQASNTGQLYGSVSVRDIVEALGEKGHKVAKQQIVLDRPIKSIGMHEVKVSLHPEVAVAVQVNVARSPEEAELQAQGIDVMQQMFEQEQAELRETAEEAGVDIEAADAEAEAIREGEVAPEQVAGEAGETGEAEEAAEAEETKTAQAGEAAEAETAPAAQAPEAADETPAEARGEAKKG